MTEEQKIEGNLRNYIDRKMQAPVWILSIIIVALLAMFGFILREYYFSSRDQNKTTQENLEQVNLKLTLMNLKLENIEELQRQSMAEINELDVRLDELERRLIQMENGFIDLRDRFFELKEESGSN